MLIGTENSHLRKYMTALGVSIIAGSFTLGGLFFRTQADLLVEANKVAALTPTAQRTLARRQDYLEFATFLLPWILATTVLIGIFLAVWGLRGWSARQRVIDQKQDAERDRSRLEVSKLTRDEEEAKRAREAVESVNLAPEQPKTGGKVSILPPQTVDQADVDKTTTIENADVNARIRAIQVVENHFNETLAVATRMNVESNVRIMRAGALENSTLSCDLRMAVRGSSSS